MVVLLRIIYLVSNRSRRVPCVEGRNSKPVEDAADSVAYMDEESPRTGAGLAEPVGESVAAPSGGFASSFSCLGSSNWCEQFGVLEQLPRRPV